MIVPKAPVPVASASAPVVAPSWTSNTSTSASPLSALPSVSSSAYRFTWLTIGAIARPCTPPGLTSPGMRSSVVAPMKPTLTPPRSTIDHGVKAGSVVPASTMFDDT